MTFQIRVVTIADNGQEQVHDITSLERTELKMETLGLTLAEHERDRAPDHLVQATLGHASISTTRVPVEDDVPDEASPFPHQEELSSKAEEFHQYITNNAKLIPNYAERRRYGERVATGFVESTVNQVVSKRMVKRQQMRWSERGAHELLQVRTHVLNDDLLEAFGRWYPGMNVGSGRTAEKKAA